jgi:integrase|tara:strand:- start:1337 stop:2479 length:1143 start_codon:yes stop_codon:yes gene_type:complete
MKVSRIAGGTKRTKPWRARVSTGERNSSGYLIYKNFFGATATEAREAAQKFLANQILKPQLKPTTNKTLKDAADELIQDWHTAEKLRLENPNKGMNPDTVTRNKQWIDAVFRFVNPSIKLSQIDKLFIRRLLNDLHKSGFSDSKKTRIWRFFGQIIDSAVMSDYMDFNPCKLFKKHLPTYEAAKVKAIDADTMKRVFKYLAELHHKGMSLEAEAALVFIIECFTAVRWGEAAALTVDDFDFDNNYIRINKTKSVQTGVISRTKSSQLRLSHGEDGERYVPFPKGLEPLFRDYISTKKHALFSVSYSYCAEIQNRIKKNFGLDNFNTKSFRKFVSTNYRKLGADTKHTQALLGHKDADTQDDYITYDVPTQFADDLLKTLN